MRQDISIPAIPEASQVNPLDEYGLLIGPNFSG